MSNDFAGRAERILTKKTWGFGVRGRVVELRVVRMGGYGDCVVLRMLWTEVLSPILYRAILAAEVGRLAEYGRMLGGGLLV
jgi:hypothetical protein